MRRVLLLTAAAFGLLLIGAGCGVQGSNKMNEIDPGDVPFGLSETSTTSTTTSTTVAPSTTMAPSTTAPPEPSTTVVVTTVAIETEPVDLYFPTGSRLAKISKPLAKDAKAPQILAALVDGPPAGDLGTGLRTIIPSRAIMAVEVVAGVAVVELPLDLFDGVSPADERLVYGQIVLTLTSARGIGQVSFTQGAEPLRVILEDGSRGEPGQLLVFDDFDQLLTGGVVLPPVTSTTSTTSTTAVGSGNEVLATTSTPSTTTTIPGSPADSSTTAPLP